MHNIITLSNCPVAHLAWISPLTLFLNLHHTIIIRIQYIITTSINMRPLHILLLLLAHSLYLYAPTKRNRGTQLHTFNINNIGISFPHHHPPLDLTMATESHGSQLVIPLFLLHLLRGCHPLSCLLSGHWRGHPLLSEMSMRYFILCSTPCQFRHAHGTHVGCLWRGYRPEGGVHCPSQRCCCWLIVMLGNAVH